MADPIPSGLVTELAEGTPLKGLRRRGVFSVKNPEDAPSGDYFFVKNNHGKLDGRRFTTQFCYNLESGSAWTRVFGPNGWTDWAATSGGGEPGPPGQDGAQGPPGPQGAAGADGADGNTGATGAQGPQGEIGPAGAQGPQGATGAAGAQGAQGSVGPQGLTGSQGIQGIQGIPGNTGPEGPQGETGADGPAGAQGPQGNTGSQGIQGPQGPTGNTGATGSQGIQGIQGLQGAQGDQGIQGIPGVTRVKAGSNVVNNNVLANTLAATGLTFAALANRTYLVRAFISYDAAATTTGSRWVILGPAGAVGKVKSRYTLTATTETTNFAALNAPAASNASSLTTGNVAEIFAVITTAATPGNISTSFASEVALSAVTFLAAFSYLEYTDITTV